MKKTAIQISAIFILISCCVALSAQTEKSFSSKNMFFIKGATFQMGSPENESWREKDETLHTVTLDGFYISRYEVTQEEYERIMGKNPSSFKGKEKNLPVENVTWYDAAEFCNALSKAEGLTPVYKIDGEDVEWNKSANGYRLPTESEWEFAARAGTKTPFSSAKVPGDSDANFYAHYPYNIEQNYFNDSVLETRPGYYRQHTVEVGSFKPNGNGLYDIHGNVSEWCWDLYGKYPTGAVKNPSGAEKGSARIARGGGWNDFGKHMRCAYRSSQMPDEPFSSRGFRVARNGK